MLVLNQGFANGLFASINKNVKRTVTISMDSSVLQVQNFSAASKPTFSYTPTMFSLMPHSQFCRSRRHLTLSALATGQTVEATPPKHHISQVGSQTSPPTR